MLDPFDRSVSAARAEDTTSFLATKVGSRVVIGMVATTFGRVEEFDANREEWSQYVERLGHFFEANGINDRDRKRSVFLAVIDQPACKLLCKLVSPAKPGDKLYEELVHVMTEHHNPTPLEIVQRYKFHSRFRQQGESVATFVAELWSLAEFCKFQGNLERHAGRQNRLRD